MRRDMKKKLVDCYRVRSREGVSMRVTKQISASLYVKAAKTMSKKEKRRYLPKEMK